MQSDNSIASVLKTGKRYFDGVIGKDRNEHVKFMKTLQGATHAMDPLRFNSISSIALSEGGLNFHHKIPFGFLLQPQEISNIANQRFDLYPRILHNLSAEKQKQKVCFANGELLLNSWELLCMCLCKHIQGLSSPRTFYVPEFEAQSVESARLDDSRIALVILSKLVEFV